MRQSSLIRTFPTKGLYLVVQNAYVSSTKTQKACFSDVLRLPLVCITPTSVPKLGPTSKDQVVVAVCTCGSLYRHRGRLVSCSRYPCGLRRRRCCSCCHRRPLTDLGRSKFRENQTKMTSKTEKMVNYPWVIHYP